MLQISGLTKSIILHRWYVFSQRFIVFLNNSPKKHNSKACWNHLNFQKFCPSMGPKWYDFVPSKLLWTGTNCFVQVQIILVRLKLDFSGLIFIIWTCPKWFGPDQNKLYRSKTISTYSTNRIWTVQNHFGPIEGQGISLFQIPMY